MVDISVAEQPHAKQEKKRDYSVSLTVFGAFLGPKKRAASSERMSDYDYPL